MSPPPTHSRVNPAVLPIPLRKRTKTLATVYKPLEDPAYTSSHSPELAQPSYTVFCFLKSARFPPTLLSTSPSAWGLSPHPHTPLCSFPYLINLYLASSCYFSSSKEAVPTLLEQSPPLYPHNCRVANYSPALCKVCKGRNCVYFVPSGAPGKKHKT